MKKLTTLSKAAVALTIAISVNLVPVAAFATFSGGVAGGASSARGVDQPADLFGQSGIFTTITNVMLFIIGAVSVIMIIIGGLRYILSGGDSGAVTSAKNTILYAIVGIIVALLAYAIVQFVIGAFVDGGGISSGGGGGAATGF